MSRFRAWGVAAALALGAATPAVAAPPPAADAAAPADSRPQGDSRPWYKKVFSAAPKPAGPAVRSGPVAAPPGRVPTVTAPLPPEVVKDALQAECDAWNRRMLVCVQLRQVALDRNDELLMRQVDELERQANALYQQRVQALGVPKRKAPLPPDSSAGFAASLDLAPERVVDPKAAAARLTAPGNPIPTGTAGLREVKP